MPQRQLNNTYWIGGGSAAGKSTVARRIAALRGVSIYSTDEMMADHASRSSPEDCPLLHKFMAMDMDQRWVNRSPKAMFETFHWFHGEGFGLVIEDLRGLLVDQGVIVEGFRLLPHLVQPFLAKSSRAIWLLPTPEFREAVVQSRGGSTWSFLAKTRDPEKALRNLLERDRMFTDMLREQTALLGLHAIEVDTTMTENDLVNKVMDVFTRNR